LLHSDKQSTIKVHKTAEHHNGHHKSANNDWYASIEWCLIYL